jgi:hypothetical protein
VAKRSKGICDDRRLGAYTASAVNGTYDVYINGTDTGTDIAISGAANSIMVSYYTVSFDVADAGAALNSTVAATYDGTAITTGTTVLGGKTLVITAAGAGASTYSYAWLGTGTSGETAAALTIAALSGAVDATCTVTGTTVPVVIGLGDTSFSTDIDYSFPGLTLTSSSNIGVVTINADKAAASAVRLRCRLTEKHRAVRQPSYQT